MKNLFLLIISLVVLSSCRTISTESVSDIEHFTVKSNKNVNKNFNIEKLNSKYYLISNKYDSIKYLILIDNLQNETNKKPEIRFDSIYEVNYYKNHIFAFNNNDKILFNIPSYNYTSKSIDLDVYKPTRIVNVAGITQTTLSRNKLRYYYEEDFPTDGGGGIYSGIKCTSGGPGATHCATNSTVGPLSTGCEVTCETGYYACCDDGRTICKCIRK